MSLRPEYPTDHPVKINSELYSRIRKERERLGLPVADIDQTLHDHPLVGKYLLERSTGKEYLIEKVKRQWYLGWTLSILYQHNGSHGFCTWEVERSMRELDHQHVAANKARFILITRIKNA